jgi:hypothetical protein
VAVVVAFVESRLVPDGDEENVVHAGWFGPLFESDKLDVNVAVELWNDVDVVANEVCRFDV